MENHVDIPWVMTILIAEGIGLAGIGVYAWAQKSWTVLACALLIAVAAAVAGGLLGFIFGIPKTVTTASSASGTATAEYQGNTNLEQVSDWLTKLLVGAGLTQIDDLLTSVGTRFGTNGVLGTGGWIVGPAIIIAYSVTGFLLAYLWARIYMTQALIAGSAEAASGQRELKVSATTTSAA